MSKQRIVKVTPLIWCPSDLKQHAFSYIAASLTLTIVFILRIFKIYTENGQINTIKTGLNKYLVLSDSLPPIDGQRPYFRAC